MYWIYFLCSGFLSNLHLPWEKELPWNFSLLVLNILFTFRIFEQLVLAQKKRVCLEIFHCEYIFFIIQNFWATCAGPEKQSLPYNFSLYWIYFLSFRIWATCASPEKQSVPWNFSLDWIYFCIQYFWATCACTEKQICPKILTVLKYHLLFRILNNLRLPWKRKSALEFFTVLKYFVPFWIF